MQYCAYAHGRKYSMAGQAGVIFLLVSKLLKKPSMCHVSPMVVMVLFFPVRMGPTFSPVYRIALAVVLASLVSAA